MNTPDETQGRINQLEAENARLTATNHRLTVYNERLRQALLSDVTRGLAAVLGGGSDKTGGGE